MVKKLEGVQTIETIMSLLDVNRQKAIYTIHKLKKDGYVKTQREPSKRRIYNISLENKQGGISYYDIINKHAPIGVKINPPETYKIYGREVTLEESLVFAVKSRNIRLLLASLSLFRKITDWFHLYKLAKANYLEREIGALYDISKNVLRARRMDGRVRRLMSPTKEDKWKYIIEKYKTKSKKIEKIENYWKIYIPFNDEDLQSYKEE